MGAGLYIRDVASALEVGLAELRTGPPLFQRLPEPGTLHLSAPISPGDFASPSTFTRLLSRIRSDPSWRGGLTGGPLPRPHAPLLASTLLRAVQSAALSAMSREWSTEGRRTDVPEAVEAAVARLLELVEACARGVGATPRPMPLRDALSWLHCEIARAEERVWLPLRTIPTAPLTGADLVEHYAGRPDEHARHLARQIRHADGAILVSGYRGVGKSSFVNRALHHAISAQDGVPADGWILVPVHVNLAKVSGVQNVLRLTLRGLRNALLETNALAPRPVPGSATGGRLPLGRSEIERLPVGVHAGDEPRRPDTRSDARAELAGRERVRARSREAGPPTRGVGSREASDRRRAKLAHRAGEP